MVTVLTSGSSSQPGESLLYVSPVAWGIFLAFVTTAILLDLLVFNRKAEEPSVKKAAVQSVFWIGLGLAIGAAVWVYFGSTAGMEYLTGYVIEKSLSVDNIFVWGVVLGFFAVPRQYRHRVLFWGIFGALVMRFIFIILGVALIERFAFMIIILGLILIWTAWKLAKSDDDEYDVSKSRAYHLMTRYLPIAKGQYGQRFTVRQGGKLLFTSTFVCLIMVEITDLIFAVDSVPAILAVARDPFIIFASNAMAILGLRSLYFLFDAIKDKFTRLNEGLAIILGGVGVKMIASSDQSFGFFQLPGYHLPTWISLTFIGVVLTGSVVASLIWPEREGVEVEEAAPQTSLEPA